MAWGPARLAILLLVAACGSQAPARRTSPRIIPEQTKVQTAAPPGSPPPPSPSAAPASPAPASLAPAPASLAPAPPAVTRHVSVRGLTGTLNTDDVHQTMDARRPALDACIGESRRSLRWISGSIRFAFRVDAEGHVSEVHPTESSIGHNRLERCIGDAVAATTFPAPAGHAAAQFSWGMTVEPAPGRPPDPLDAEQLKKLLRKRSPDLRRACEVRRRERFKVTAYIAPGGRVVSAGAVPMPPKAAEKLDCVLEAIGEWRMPKVDRHAKVSFLLR